jgi:hypothetical protein
MRWLALLLIAGCSHGTEVVVSVASELSAPDLQAIQIIVTNPGEATTEPIYQSARLPVCAPGKSKDCFPFPVTLTLVPGDSKPKDLMKVNVQAMDTSGAVVISDASVFSFVPGASQKLQFYLYKNCLASDCSQLDQTCGSDGACANARPSGAPPPAAPGGASQCPGSFPVCDGFEDGTLSRWMIFRGDTYQSPVTVPTNPVIDDSRAYRGTHSVWLHAQGSDDDQINRAVYLAVAPPAPVTWTRWFTYVGPGLPSTKVAQLSPGPIELAAQQLSSNVAGGMIYNSGKYLPTDRWSCVEWMYDGNAGELRTFLDGEELSELHQTDAPRETPSEFALGVFVSKGPTYDVWIDEVALDSQRIGCDR